MTDLNRKPSSSPTQVAIIGTGYIADFHAKAIARAADAQLVAVIDANVKVAEAFGANWGVPAFASLDAAMAKHAIDAVHVLVPPDLHYPLSVQAIDAGLHLMVEKPMTASVAEATDLVARGVAANRLVRVNHSMVFQEAFAKLRDHIQRGDLGPLDHLSFNHFAELGFIRFGPFNNWMLREPGNALLEIGSHPISGVIDLVGAPDDIQVLADRDVVLPGGARAYRRWRIRATAGRTAIDVNLDLGPGFSQRTVTARGALGTAVVDLDADTCVIDRRTRGGIDFDRYNRSREQASQLKRQARHALTDYVLSKAKVKQRGNPYEKSILDSVSAFYAELRGTGPADPRIAAETGLAVVDTCYRVIAAANLKGHEPATARAARTPIQPKVLVLGGTGFIGRRLIQKLLDRGVAVRAAGRSTSPALEQIDTDLLETVRADMRSPADIERALEGIEVVYHLATTDAKNWPEYLEREVEPTRMLAEACLARGVKRLIYTGTIDSYYAGGRAGKITEDTPLDAKIARRNHYARAKAAGEALLTDLHRTRGLPLVIARPGIVIGAGGNPFHWGVGMWRSDGLCEVWGDGQNKLPLVLVDDVADGLARMMDVPGIEGRSYNLIDAPIMSARDYLDELQQMAKMRIDVNYRPITRFYLDDLLKWPFKVALGHPDAARRPSYHDWESRTQKALFDCSRTRTELGWTPASSREKLIDEGIGGSLAAWLAARG